jgi:hypothetical protein
MITAVSVSPRHRLSLGDADDWASHGKRLQRRAQSVRLPLLYDWCSSKMGVDHLPPIERGYGLSVCCRLLSVVARRVRWEGASCAHRSRGVVASAAYLTHRFVARDDTREIIVCVMQMLWMEYYDVAPRLEFQLPSFADKKKGRDRGWFMDIDRPM